MAIQSMTGFARARCADASNAYVWEIRSVNGKGLDIRLRLPPGLEHLEPEIRKKLGSAFARGNLQVSLAIAEGGQALEAVINEAALESVLALVDRLSSRIDAAPPRLDGLLNIRGMVELREPALDDEARGRRDAALGAGLDEAITALSEGRQQEGAALVAVLQDQLERVAALVEAVENSPARTPEAIRARLADQLAALLDAGAALDPDRLAMEAALLATKADLREEIDRLKAHVTAARALLAGSGPVGRRLDFLAQEFNRETNTICSKSNAAAVTAIGLDLKVLIDQFREQIQNLE
ncbi:YicC/YloC family endoribonuclease [Pseudohoeflea coraliihabitans]|uniref:YicC family protein n=1 Tax=Pseudohoeflea coraliihabitans TaxID=2860393 RepID=A0ABS6WRW1_9HYPH|nr:YicC/YloC family endoribonuclease [Pseudohoeflea sp. DP4N28-3]MBW3098706.1 YicC family protein [Pseudohoeflea sp. DP4N28-3]